MKTNTPKVTNKRKLKITEKSVERSCYKWIVVPQIILRGKWLEHLGFECGQTVDIQSEGRKIIITPVEDT